VSPVSEGDTWRCRNIQIKNASKSLEVKLWNDKADIEVDVGDEVNISNVCVEDFSGQKTVSSSDETTTEVFYFNCI